MSKFDEPPKKEAGTSKSREGRINIGQQENLNNSRRNRSEEELGRIKEIERRLQEQAQSSLPQQEKELDDSTDIETVEVSEQIYTVEYVKRETIYPAFGFSADNRAVVRDDLSPRVKRFVRAHELFHCKDKSSWGGWIGREIRANIVPGMKDPMGLVATAWATISDIDRIKFYFRRIKEGQ